MAMTPKQQDAFSRTKADWKLANGMAPRYVAAAAIGHATLDLVDAGTPITTENLRAALQARLNQPAAPFVDHEMLRQALALLPPA